VARRAINDEQRSYAVWFLVAVALLLIGAVWSVYDDNISRRPWKYHQARFFDLERQKLKSELAAEEERLAADPDYQKIQSDLAAAHEKLHNGATAQRIAELEKRLHQVKTEHGDYDLELRIQKSRLEEAWYEYEHALHNEQPTEAHKKHIEELDEGRLTLDKGFTATAAEIKQIESELNEVRSEVDNLEDELEQALAERRRIAERLDAIGIKVGPWQFPKIPKIHQVVLPEYERSNFDNPLMRVDRCTSCHVGINRPGFEDAPQPYRTHSDRELLLGNHDPDKMGCTPCHQGQGPAVNSTAQAHGNVKFWEQPLLTGNEVQATCIGCHGNVEYLEGADAIAAGEKLFEELGCHGCHLAVGYEDLARVGPYLRRLRAKVDPSWLIRWVQNPHDFRPHTRMPNFMFDQEEAVAIASYLWTTTKGESEEWLANRPAPAGVDPTNATLVEQGKELADSLGCRGCHGFAEGEAPGRLGETKDVAPNLSNIAEKTDARWIYYWIKGPEHYSPDARMPSLRLADEEAVAITSYLMTLGGKEETPELVAKLDDPGQLKRGEALVRKYGCAGCHNVTGMENAARIGAELTSFGSKPLSEMFFGDRTDIPHTWADFTYWKLKQPRTYQTERIEQVMPNFNLADSEIKSLRRFLYGRRAERIPPRYRADTTEVARQEIRGRRVVARYNCVGCHVIQGKGGAIRALYGENLNLAPPVLNGEGAKVQSEWLFNFLRRPVTLRPWLKVRMPTFNLTDEETTALVDYFAALEGVELPFVHTDPHDVPRENLEAAKILMSEEYFACFSCHQRGDQAPEGPPEGWAPDLAMANQRLRPDWIVRWLRNPQAVQPGTKMPSFYEEGEDGSPEGGPDDVLDGDNLRQIHALRDYIMVLNQAETLTADASTNGTEPAAAADDAAAETEENADGETSSEL
jgi:mono/diheme cytochrome c family protein/predicted  nucleic acid-binding Zn-ribbon protein